MESFIGWIGGKRMLRKAILERFPTDEVVRVCIEKWGRLIVQLCHSGIRLSCSHLVSSHL